MFRLRFGIQKYFETIIPCTWYILGSVMRSWNKKYPNFFLKVAPKELAKNNAF